MRMLERLGTARAAVLVGIALRLLAFPFAEDLWADAPVRSDIASAWARAPGLWWSYREVLQFGPLPSHLEGALVWLGLGHDVGPRLVPLLFGLAGLALSARVGRRLGGEEGAAFAAWALALSPVHLQASTTCATEAIYLAFALGVTESILFNRTWTLALAAFGAATTRYDTWLWLPPLALHLLWRERSPMGLCKALLLALGPATILLANAVELGRPFAPLQHISGDHTALTAALLARFGPVLWRAMSVAFWPAAVLVVLTPLFGTQAMRALRLPDRERLPSWLVALVPPAIYAVRGAITGTFLPMLRMAGPPAQILATLGRPARSTLVTAIAVAAIFDVAVLGLASFSNPLQSAAQRASPVSRLDDDLRAGVAALREQPDAALDQSATWEDIVIAHHAGRDRFGLYAPPRAPKRIIAIRGARLDAELRGTGRAFGGPCTRTGEVGRISWWDCRD